MRVYHNPDRHNWQELLQRPQIELGFLDSAVRNILNRVKKSGDSAIRELTQQFDKVALDNLKVTEDDVTHAVKSIPPTLSKAIETAAKNIEKFHAAQRREVMTVETMPGVRCWRKPVPITKVGIYIPGGSAPLFSTVLMLGVPAKLAGCEEVVLCTPPDKTGKINAAILFAANLVGIKQIYKIGGAQAIAALAYGTETIPSVYKIFGPGNQYVTKAKQLVTEDGIAIDMPAGPSEVLVVADETSNPKFIAADLLSQAEHGEDSQVTLVLLNESMLPAIQKEIETQLNTLPRKNIAAKALDNSNVVLFPNLGTATEFINAYAPEHLIVNLKNAEEFAEDIVNAGSVFLGSFSPEAIGDYASGTNHTLPTNGYAKAYAGVSLESFMKYITFQQLSETGIKTLGPVVVELAEAEQLIGHRIAVQVRLDALKSKS
jgi:histidinol dehydrogenase